MDKKTKKIGQFSYDVTAVLGKGCFGEVYLGWENSNPDLKFAVKKVDRKWIEENDVLKNCFISELNILRKITNDNVIRFKSYVQTERSYYLITEYIEGGTLEQKIAKGAIPEDQCILFLKDILNGWRSLVSLGVVHRDLKPENILIKDKSYKIADFGFAKSIEYHLSKLHQTRLGSPYFMAPQIHCNESYTSKCDIWSLGVILYRMLYKELPWQSDLNKRKTHVDIYREKPPLVLPWPIKDSNFQDFLVKCLSITEQGRMSWRQVYQHPLVKWFSLDPFIENQHLYNQSIFKSQFFQLQEKFNKLFPPEVYNRTHLGMDEFSKYLLQHNFTENVISSLFNKFTKNKQTVNLKQIKNWLQEYELLIDQPRLSKIEKQISEVTKAIKLYLKRFDLDVFDLFKEFDVQDTDYLEKQDFIKLLMKVGTFSESDMQATFEKFDIKSQGNVSFKTFRNIIYTQFL